MSASPQERLTDAQRRLATARSHFLDTAARFAEEPWRDDLRLGLSEDADKVIWAEHTVFALVVANEGTGGER